MVFYYISKGRKGRKLYLRRLVALLLLHPDPAVALQLDENRAQQVVDKLRQSPALSGGNEIGAEQRKDGSPIARNANVTA